MPLAPAATAAAAAVLPPDLLDSKADKCNLKKAWGEHDDDPQLQFYPTSVSVDLSLLCPNTSDGKAVSPQ